MPSTMVHCTLAKEVNGTLTYLSPRTTADIVEFDPGDNSGNVSVQAKLRTMSTDLYGGIQQINSGLANYYTKTQIDNLLYTPIEVQSVTVSPAACRIGSTNNSITVTYKLNRDPTTLTVDGSAISSPTKSGTKTVTVSSQKAITVRAVDEKSYANEKSATVYFYAPIYYGVLNTGTDMSASNGANIKNLSESIQGNVKCTFDVNCTSGKSIFFACPSTMSPAFYVNGFAGGFTKITNSPITFRNASNSDQSYNVYRSTNAELGQTTVTVT